MRWLRRFAFCALLIPLAAFAGETPAELEYRATARREQLDRVLPLLVNEKELTVLHRQLAMALRQQQPANLDAAARAAAQQLISRPLVGDIRVIYAIDVAGLAPLVSQAQLDDWGIDTTRLDEQALDNLRKHFGNIPHKTVARLPWLEVIDSADGYVASRMLLTRQWAELAATRGGAPLMAGVPTRDVVVFATSTEQPQIEQLADTIATVAEHEDHPISARLYEWSPDGWREVVRPVAQPTGLVPHQR